MYYNYIPCFLFLKEKESKFQHRWAVAIGFMQYILWYTCQSNYTANGLCYSNDCTLTRNILQQEAVVLHVLLPGVLCHLQQVLSVSNNVGDSMFHFLQYICLLLHKNSNLKTFCVEDCGWNNRPLEMSTISLSLNSVFFIRSGQLPISVGKNKVVTVLLN